MILACELKGGAQVDIGLSGSGFHLDIELQAIHEPIVDVETVAILYAAQICYDRVLIEDQIVAVGAEIFGKVEGFLPSKVRRVEPVLWLERLQAGHKLIGVVWLPIEEGSDGLDSVSLVGLVGIKVKTHRVSSPYAVHKSTLWVRHSCTRFVFSSSLPLKASSKITSRSGSLATSARS